MPKSVLITGGAGFVGSSLATLIRRDNPEARVYAFDNLKRRGSELNLPRLKAAGVTFLHGDVRNQEDFEQVPQIDTLIDCAAEPSVLAGYASSPAYVINTNLTGTLNCLETARKYKADFIFLSTSRVYPIHPLGALQFTEGPSRLQLKENYNHGLAGLSSRGVSELFPLDGSRSIYGSTKLASELFLQEYIEIYGLRGIINRCGVLTGPWQMGKVDQGVMVLWVASHIFKKKLAYIGYGGTGKQVRDVLHVEDLYALLRMQMANLEAHSGRIYNVGGGLEISVSLRELTGLCEEITGSRIEIQQVAENRAGDIPWYVTDNSLVEKSTGWRPTRSVREIVAEIAGWILKHQKDLAPILS